MKNQEIKLKTNNHKYSIIIGENTLRVLPQKIKSLCPKTKKIATIKITITNNNFIKVFIIELPILGCLLYLSCIRYELI